MLPLQLASWEGSSQGLLWGRAGMWGGVSVGIHIHLEVRLLANLVRYGGRV